MTLKEQLFNRNTVSILAESVANVYHSFDSSSFIEDSLIGFTGKELKERITVLRLNLEKYLPEDFMVSSNILKESLLLAKTGNFVYGSFLEFLEFGGCNDQFIDYTLDLLQEFTKVFSAEFVIRRFINEYEDKTYTKMLEWSTDENVHVRRLASEGLRPKLPWSVGINIDYLKAAIPLHNLYYDKERYVTRSVANHLNDISKIDPPFVLECLNTWRGSNKQDEKEMAYIISHSLRTLVKKGHADTLTFLGYNNDLDITCENLVLHSTEVTIGDHLEFSFNIHSKEDVKLVIDYIIVYPSTTKKVIQKVYKLKSLILTKDKSIEIKGKRAFKEISTRKMKPGLHQIIIQINGKRYLTEEFNLK